jgi:hypothetical protein
MATNNTERFGFSVSAGNDRPDPCNLRIMTLERVNKIIENKRYEPKLTSQLKRMASLYPQQALENFVQNFDHHLLKARQAIRISKPTTSPVEAAEVTEVAEITEVTEVAVEEIVTHENSHAPSVEEFE